MINITCKEAWKTIYDYVKDAYDENHVLSEAMFILAEAAKYQDNYNE